MTSSMRSRARVVVSRDLASCGMKGRKADTCWQKGKGKGRKGETEGGKVGFKGKGKDKSGCNGWNGDTHAWNSNTWNLFLQSRSRCASYGCHQTEHGVYVLHSCIKDFLRAGKTNSSFPWQGC